MHTVDDDEEFTMNNEIKYANNVASSSSEYIFSPSSSIVVVDRGFKATNVKL